MSRVKKILSNHDKEKHRTISLFKISDPHKIWFMIRIIHKEARIIEFFFRDDKLESIVDVYNGLCEMNDMIDVQFAEEKVEIER